MEKITPKNRDEKEILGYRDVLNTIHLNYEYIPITPFLILQLHRDLYKYSEKNFAGKFKNTQNYISSITKDGKESIIFTPLPPYQTPQAIEKICTSFNQAIDSSIIEPLVLILTFINDFLCIHPFNDGNGRMSRLLTTLLLYQQGFLVGRYISLETKIERTKEVYYNVLNASGVNWHNEENDIFPFIKYLLGIILSAYRDFEDRVNFTGEKLSALDLVRRAITKKIGKFTKTEIMELTPTIRKASVENSLKKLVEEGVIIRHGKGKASFYTKFYN